MLMNKIQRHLKVPVWKSLENYFYLWKIIIFLVHMVTFPTNILSKVYKIADVHLVCKQLVKAMLMLLRVLVVTTFLIS